MWKVDYFKTEREALNHIDLFGGHLNSGVDGSDTKALHLSWGDMLGFDPVEYPYSVQKLVTEDYDQVAELKMVIKYLQKDLAYFMECNRKWSEFNKLQEDEIADLRERLKEQEDKPL